jgi:hypothetical protein
MSTGVVNGAESGIAVVHVTPPSVLVSIRHVVDTPSGSMCAVTSAVVSVTSVTDKPFTTAAPAMLNVTHCPRFVSAASGDRQLVLVGAGGQAGAGHETALFVVPPPVGPSAPPRSNTTCLPRSPSSR